jgi:hypothetical protein
VLRRTQRDDDVAFAEDVRMKPPFPLQHRPVLEVT